MKCGRLEVFFHLPSHFKLKIVKRKNEGRLVNTRVERDQELSIGYFMILYQLDYQKHRINKATNWLYNQDVNEAYLLWVLPPHRREHLELLKQRNFSSGTPCVQGLEGHS